MAKAERFLAEKRMVLALAEEALRQEVARRDRLCAAGLFDVSVDELKPGRASLLVPSLPREVLYEVFCLLRKPDAAKNLSLVS